MLRITMILNAVLMLVLLIGFQTIPVQSEVTVTTLILEGDNVPGVGNITWIDNLAVNNNGEWLIEADTDFANGDMDQVLLKNGVLYLRENDALTQPPGSSLDSFDSVNLNMNGDSGFNFFLDGTSGSSDDSGIYYNTTLVIQESDISTAPQFSPNTPYIGFFDSKINNNNQIMIMSSVDDPNIASSVDRALVRLELDGAGNLLSETVIAKEGDILPGSSDMIDDMGTGPDESAFNDHGDVLYIVDFDGLSSTDGAIYLNSTLLAREGDLSPDPTRNYEFLLSRGLDLNNSMNYIFKANLNGDTADDDVLIKNGAIFKREGGTFPAISGYQIEGFGSSSGPVQIDDNGNVLWYCDWNDPDTSIDTGLFLNETMIVQEGVTMTTDNQVIDTITNFADAFMLSDDGHWLIFEGQIVDEINAAFLVEITPSSSVDEFSESVIIHTISNTPNPFSRGTTLHYTLRSRAGVSIQVYDISGRSIAHLANRRQEPGTYEIEWNGCNDNGVHVKSGMYMIRMTTPFYTVNRAVMLLR